MPVKIAYRAKSTVLNNAAKLSLNNKKKYVNVRSAKDVQCPQSESLICQICQIAVWRLVNNKILNF